MTEKGGMLLCRRQKKKVSVTKIKREDEDVRPAGEGRGGWAALYLLSGNLEMLIWPLDCPRLFGVEHL